MAPPAIRPLDESRAFEPHELFFSTTDPAGVIRYGNDVFCRIAGYGFEELVGRPHNVIRHPDMPRCVFRLLWAWLEEGRTVAAYVKNLASDGRYYWVLALVMPCAGGYLSIRLKPEGPCFDAAREVYRAVLAVEQQAEEQGARRQEAIDRGEEALLQALAGAGFARYEDFMYAALGSEMDLRRAREEATGSLRPARPARPADTIPAPASAPAPDAASRLTALFERASAIDRELGEVFAKPGGFTRLRDEIIPKSRFIRKLGRSIRMQALNAQVESARLGDEALALAMVAERLGVHAGEGTDQISVLNAAMRELVDPIAALIFESQVSKVQIEMAARFVECMAGAGGDARTGSPTTSKRGGGGGESDEALVTENLELLFATFVARARRIPERLRELHEGLETVARGVHDLRRFVKTLHFVHFAGRVETARTTKAATFATIFENVQKMIEESEQVLDDLIERVAENEAALRALAGLESLEPGSLEVLGGMLSGTSAPQTPGKSEPQEQRRRAAA